MFRNADKNITNKLPVEIISKIFGLTTPDNTDDTLEELPEAETLWTIKLGAICKFWRQIAWTTPQLWNKVAIAIDTANPHDNLAHTVQWISRSRNLPLIIRIYALYEHDDKVYDPTDNSTTPPYTLILDEIAKWSHRWKYINLDMPAGFMMYVFQRAIQFPMLEAMHIRPSSWGEKYDDCQLFATVLPSPRRAFLGFFDTYQCNLNFERITEISLFAPTFPQMIKLLQCASMLESLAVQSIQESFEELDEHISLPLTHQKLAKITVNRTTCDWFFYQFVRSITLPNLQILVAGIQDEEETQILAATLTRSSCPLKTLELAVANISYEEVYSILRASPFLTHLDLYFMQDTSDLVPSSVMNPLRLLADLTPSEPLLAAGHGESSSTLFLPSLEYLELKFITSTFPWNSLRGIFGPLSANECLPMRRALLKFVVTHICNGTIEHVFPPDVFHQLTPIRMAGVDIIFQCANISTAALDRVTMFQDFSKYGSFLDDGAPGAKRV